MRVRFLLQKIMKRVVYWQMCWHNARTQLPGRDTMSNPEGIPKGINRKHYEN